MNQDRPRVTFNPPLGEEPSLSGLNPPSIWEEKQRKNKGRGTRTLVARTFGPRMSKLPGSAGVSVLADRSLEFYRDPVSFCRRRMDKHRSRVFQSRLLNRATAFVCSVRGMKELLCGEVACSQTPPARMGGCRGAGGTNIQPHVTLVRHGGGS